MVRFWSTFTPRINLCLPQERAYPDGPTEHRARGVATPTPCSPSRVRPQQPTIRNPRTGKQLLPIKPLLQIRRFTRFFLTVPIRAIEVYSGQESLPSGEGDRKAGGKRRYAAEGAVRPATCTDELGLWQIQRSDLHCCSREHPVSFNTWAVPLFCHWGLGLIQQSTSVFLDWGLQTSELAFSDSASDLQFGDESDEPKAPNSPLRAPMPCRRAAPSRLSLSRPKQQAAPDNIRANH